MKIKLLTLLLAIVCVGSLQAQTEFAPLGATWYYSVADENGNPLSSYEKYVSNADTIIDGKICRLVVSPSDTIIFYSNNGKIYNVFRGHFLLTYDFGAKVGDTVEIDFRANKPYSIVTDTFYTVQCVVKKTDLLTNSNLKNYKLEMIPRSDLEGYTFGTYSYVENVGYEDEPMFKLTNLVSPGITVGTCYLRCYEDGSLKYTSDWWVSYGKDCDYKETSNILIDKNSVEINITPNPVCYQLFVKSDYIEKPLLELQIVSAQGCIMVKCFIQSGESIIDVSSLNGGIYYVSIFNKRECLSTTKIVKQ